MHRLLSLLSLAVFLVIPWGVRATETSSPVRTIAFPTDSTLSFTDNYGDPRSGHSHIGIDILGPKMTPLYAAVTGYVQYIVIPEARYGYEIVLADDDGWTYHYIHMNNDTPGTDDGNGGPEHAYAPGLRRGSTVQKGQLIGWMGDSGNAESIASHLHFEIHGPSDDPINPYPSLIAAQSPLRYSATAAMAASPDINTDKSLAPVTNTACDSGTLIKSAQSSAVYYCGADGKRYVFPNDRVYFSWYTDFRQVITVTDIKLASVPLGGLVTYRPGTKMVKIESLTNVYAIEKGGTLRWIKTPALAASLYGATWNKKVEDVSDAFFGSYRMGEEISAAR